MSDAYTHCLVRTGLYAESHGIVANVRRFVSLVNDCILTSRFRIFGTQLLVANSTTTASNRHGFRNGGTVNRYVRTTSFQIGPFTSSRAQMWETAENAGIITANLMWYVAIRGVRSSAVC